MSPKEGGKNSIWQKKTWKKSPGFGRKKKGFGQVCPPWKIPFARSKREHWSLLMTGATIFSGKKFEAHSVHGQKISSPTQHRVIIFRCPLLKNTIDQFSQERYLPIILV